MINAENEVIGDLLHRKLRIALTWGVRVLSKETTHPNYSRYLEYFTKCIDDIDSIVLGLKEKGITLKDTPCSNEFIRVTIRNQFKVLCEILSILDNLEG